MTEKLKAGDTFPTMQVQTIANGTLTIPGDLKTCYSLLLFYRGWW